MKVPRGKAGQQRDKRRIETLSNEGGNFVFKEIFNVASIVQILVQFEWIN